MTNLEAVDKINQILSYDFHFTDYDFGRMDDGNERSCPRPEKKDWLGNQFKKLMTELKKFLLTNPDQDSLRRFIQDELDRIKSEEYLKEEYELLITKYGEVPLFGLEVRTAYDFLEKNSNLKKYYT